MAAKRAGSAQGDRGDATTEREGFTLKKGLSALDVTGFGVGVIIGADIFVLTGNAAATEPGHHPVVRRRRHRIRFVVWMTIELVVYVAFSKRRTRLFASPRPPGPQYATLDRAELRHPSVPHRPAGDQQRRERECAGNRP